MHITLHHRRLFIPEGVRAGVAHAATVLPTLLPRADDSSDDDDSDKEDRCAHSTTGVCERPAGTSKAATLPVVLGVVIPVVLAIAVLFFLHRRHLKKLAQEDKSDKYKSYDFGLDDVVVPEGNKRKGPGMAQREKSAVHQHGLSLDLNINTYLPPPSVLGPLGSTSTLSLTPSDMSRASTPRTADLASPFDSRRNPFDDKYAESMSARSVRSPAPSTPGGPQQPPSAYYPGAPNPVHNMDAGRPLTPQAYGQNVPEIREPSTSSTAVDDIELPKNLQSASGPNAMSVPRISLPPGAEDSISDYDRNSTQAAPNAHGDGQSHGMTAARTLDKELGLGDFGAETASKRLSNGPMSMTVPPEGYQLDPRRLTSEGIRPLPPDDPNESPDQRASRIRSFYKEYFDPKNKDANQTKSVYFGDLEDAPVDSVYGAESIPHMPPMPVQVPNAPFAQPPPRRAMTPPPRMPSEAFAGPLPNYPPWDSRPGSRASDGKAGSIRVQSSVSNRGGPTPPPPRQQKRQPPPQPLQMIPTPHAMKDDSLITLTPIDFAPAQLTKAQREGRSMTPQGDVRVPYAAIPSHIPLVSSYDDLAIMPSPHNLRKSTTFTALDFAPPPRFRNDPSRPGSPLIPPSANFDETGSMRSPSAAGSRTGAMSPAAVMTIRNGGNRVSRLPKDVVGTVDAMNEELKPRWDMTR